MPVQMTPEVGNTTLRTLNKRHCTLKPRGTEYSAKWLARLYRINLYILAGKVLLLILFRLCPLSYLPDLFCRPGILKLLLLLKLLKVFLLLKEFIMVFYLYPLHLFLRIKLHVGLFTVISISLAKTGKPSKPW
ncbi:hypothetical protein BMS3Bbin07_01164 [bacterium BMS3Bbin07]|nr:hypothetical protein BMS3Bbin07_01164 [bacterium BMS3Bbin07]